MTDNTRYESIAKRDEPATEYSADSRDSEKKGRVGKKKNSTWNSAISILQLKDSLTLTTLQQRLTNCAQQQILAFLLLSSCAIIPFFLLGHFAPKTYGHSNLFGTAFADKKISCNDGFFEGGDGPINSTVAGSESLFMLDYRLGRYTFAIVKTIDVAWDILIGRGVQALAWWTSYIVFCDAFLAVIERHPASFRVFKYITFEGASLTSLWVLLCSLLRIKSGKTRALYGYMVVAIVWILCIPVFLSAMTGYDGITATYVGIDDEGLRVIPVSRLEERYVIRTDNTTFGEQVCLEKDAEMDGVAFVKERRAYNCDCRLPNGTVLPYRESRRVPFDYGVDRNLTGATPLDPFSYCIFNFPNNNQTYQIHGSNETRNCNTTFNVQLRSQTFDLQTLNAEKGWCLDDIGYDMTGFLGKSRCLPDTENPAYQWGFSTMLSAIFVIIQLAWSLSIYALWQHAQFTSTLVRAGYRLNPLRAILALGEAATRRTGLGLLELMRADTKTLERELYGGKKDPGATVEYKYFGGVVKEGLEGGYSSVRRSRIARREDK